MPPDAVAAKRELLVDKGDVVKVEGNDLLW
jgi:hypothetical protein